MIEDWTVNGEKFDGPFVGLFIVFNFWFVCDVVVIRWSPDTVLEIVVPDVIGFGLLNLIYKY